MSNPADDVRESSMKTSQRGCDCKRVATARDLHQRKL
jgi:hypothetical protein